MKLHHLTTQTIDPAERGRAIGRLYGGFLRQSSERYLAHFELLGVPADRVRDIVDRSRSALEAWCPALVAESDASAAAAGLEPWRAFAVGARTEVLAVAPSAGEGECSTAVRVPRGAGAPETIQTWDWHDELATDGLLHHFTTESGRDVYDTAGGTRDVTKGILAAYPQSLAEANGEIGENGDPTVDYVVKSCDEGGTCAY